MLKIIRERGYIAKAEEDAVIKHRLIDKVGIELRQGPEARGDIVNIWLGVCKSLQHTMLARLVTPFYGQTIIGPAIAGPLQTCSSPDIFGTLELQEERPTELLEVDVVAKLGFLQQRWEARSTPSCAMETMYNFIGECKPIGEL
ncbi:MAG TPA: hypothetical protein VGE45_16050 [Chloroflexia bacterium]